MYFITHSADCLSTTTSIISTPHDDNNNNNTKININIITTNNSLQLKRV